MENIRIFRIAKLRQEGPTVCLIEGYLYWSWQGLLSWYKGSHTEYIYYFPLP